MKMLNSIGPNNSPLEYTISNWPPAEFCGADHNHFTSLTHFISNNVDYYCYVARIINR